MKPLSILFMVLYWTTSTLGQNREVVTARGFNNSVEAVEYMPGHQWVFATISSPAAGAIYQDTITLWVCDSTGKIIHRITSLPPIQNEIYVLDKLMVLPDTGVLLQYGGGDCDACCYAQVIQRWKNDGTLAWQKIDMEDPGTTIFSATSAHRLFAQRGYHVIELDWESGDTLWQHQYASEYRTGIFFIPGTADFLVYDDHTLSRYDMDTTGSLKYILKATLPFDDLLYDFSPSIQGAFYAVRGFQSAKLLRIDFNLSSYKDLKAIETGSKYTPVRNGVMIINRPVNSGFECILKDTLGIDTKVYVSPNNELTPYHIRSDLSGFALAGQYTAGPRNSSATFSTQAWFRYFPEDSLNQHHQLFSVGITNINQRSPVLVDSTFYNLPEFMKYFYDFSGGDFEMEVTNTGDQPVDSFWINTRFQSAWFIWFCGIDMCKNVAYHHHLDPGESVWVDFGDIYAINQFSLPGQYCFWTSGPDARPDDRREDDSKCVDRTVGLHDPAKTLFTIYPQPASDEIYISNLPEHEPKILRIYSLDGIVRKTETAEAHEHLIRIRVADLPEGYYAIKIGNQISPLVIAHPY